MKLSQLIAQLEEVLDREGDIETVSRNDESQPPVVDVVGVGQPIPERDFVPFRSKPKY